MDAIISVNAGHRIVRFNAAAEKMFGRSAMDVGGQTVDQLIPERFRAAHGEHIRRFVQTGVTSQQMGASRALIGLRADGQEFPIEASAVSQIEIGGEKLFVIWLSEPGSTEITAVALRGFRRPEAMSHRSIDLANLEPGSLYHRVIVNKEMSVIEDVSSVPGIPVFKEEGVQSAILMPIRARQQILGTILLGSRIPGKFPPELIGTLDALSNHTGIAIQKARLHEETQTSLDRIRALHEIETAITSTLDLRGVLDVLLEKIELFLPIAAPPRSGC